MLTPEYQPKVDVIDQLTLESIPWQSQPMVAKEKIRKDFSKRLHLACDEAGVRVRGRAVDIQAELKRLGITATTTAIGKWLNAEAIPEADKLRPLASWLGVRAAWLEYNEQPMRAEDPQHIDANDSARIARAAPPIPSAPASPERGELGVAAPEGQLTIDGLLDQLRLSPDGIPDPRLKAALINLLTQYQEDPNRGADIAAAILLLTKKD